MKNCVVTNVIPLAKTKKQQDRQIINLLKKMRLKFKKTQKNRKVKKKNKKQTPKKNRKVKKKHLVRGGTSQVPPAMMNSLHEFPIGI